MPALLALLYLLLVSLQEFLEGLYCGVYSGVVFPEPALGIDHNLPQTFRGKPQKVFAAALQCRG